MAEIYIITTDMGNGGAFCSKCDYCLDNGDPTHKLPPRCPNCKEIFTFIDGFHPITQKED